MSDVAEVKEALENAGCWMAEDYGDQHNSAECDACRIDAAARRWVRMVSTGKVRQLCREHHARYNDGAPGCEVWMAARQGGAEPKPCHVEDFLLVALDGCTTCGGKGYLPLVDPNGEPNPKMCPDCGVAAVGVEKDSL